MTDRTTKTWVLDTETKGTAANVVPLDRRRGRAAPARDALFVPPKRKPRPPAPDEPKAPRRFKVVDVVSGRVLATDVDARGTVDVLSGVRSIVDVHVHVWEPARDAWRMLRLDELRLLWDRR
jgi:hypothetical protein